MQVFTIGGRWFSAYVDHEGRERNVLLPSAQDRARAEAINRELQAREGRARTILTAEIERTRAVGRG